MGPAFVSASTLPQTLAAAQTRKRNRKPYAGCYLPAMPHVRAYIASPLSYCMCTSRNLAKPQQSCTSWRSRKGRGMSPSGNPQKRFTQPLLINLSRALGQLFRCGKLVIKNIFFLVQITGSIAGPGLELFLCRITRQYQFSQQSFPRSRKNLGQSRIRRL